MSEDPFRPSEYTAALLRQLWLRPACTGRVLELGTGSGVVLAALAAAGAREVVGVDLEQAAIHRTVSLLRAQGTACFSVHRGDLWQPLRGERFDLVVFNPPQLPTQGTEETDHRLHSWSHGGIDGREVFDRFLDGLDRHLAPGAQALVTHGSFMGLARTTQRLRALSLQARVTQTVCVAMPHAKLDAVSAAWLKARLGRSFRQVGPHVFTDFHVLEIGRADAA